jgi:hypothetical protein
MRFRHWRRSTNEGEGHYEGLNSEEFSEEVGNFIQVTKIYI